MNKFTKQQLCIGLHTASQWHGDRGRGPIALLSLSSTRKVHNAEHRKQLIDEIKRDLGYMMEHVYSSEYADGFEGWKRDIDRLLDLLVIVVEYPVGHEWLTDRENMKINNDLCVRGIL